MNEEELQALLNSGNPADIDKALAHFEENKKDVDGDTDSSSGDQGGEDGAETTDKDVETGSSPTEENAQGIASKNGAHVLPYSVLEAERQTNAELKRQIQEMTQREQEANTVGQQAEAMQQKMALMQEQLEANGIKPAQLAEELQLTEEELAGLGEYGEIGEVGAKTARKVMLMEKTIAALSQQLQKSAAEPVKAEKADPDQEIYDAIDATDGMADVMKDPELAKKAIAIDEQLKGMAKFQNLPLTERFAEVMKRLTPEILNGGKGRGNKQQDLDDDLAPPMSLNGIPGATADVNAPAYAQFEGKSEAEVQHLLMQMSPAQQEKVMRELGL